MHKIVLLVSYAVLVVLFHRKVEAPLIPVIWHIMETWNLACAASCNSFIADYPTGLSNFQHGFATANSRRMKKAESLCKPLQVVACHLEHFLCIWVSHTQFMWIWPKTLSSLLSYRTGCPGYIIGHHLLSIILLCTITQYITRYTKLQDSRDWHGYRCSMSKEYLMDTSCLTLGNKCMMEVGKHSKLTHICQILMGTNWSTEKMNMENLSHLMLPQMKHDYQISSVLTICYWPWI